VNDRRAAAALGDLLFAATVGVGAVLLFGVQPLAARALLSSYGGSSAVWTTCLLFFQLALLLGYAWAHLSLRWLGERRQAVLQLAVLVLALVVSVKLAPLREAPRENGLTGSLLFALAAGVGVPFVVLSTTSPLLSRWLASTDGHGQRNVYWLYAASNAGSLASLLAYPLFFERAWPLARQFQLFRGGLALFAALVTACAVYLWTRPAPPKTTVETTDSVVSTAPTTLARRGYWLLLAAVPSSLLSSVTTHLTTDIASSPLLWVLPLALYLGSFVLIYRETPLVTVATSARALPLIALGSLLIYLGRVADPGWLLLVVGLLLAFFSATLAHGLLYEARPAAHELTDFYLFGSIGGALGGAFNALVAPRVFDDLTELPLGILALCALRACVPATPLRDVRATALRDAGYAGVALGVGLALVLLTRLVPLPASLREQVIVVLVVPAFWVLRALDRPVRFTLGLGALFVVGLVFRRVAAPPLYEGRGFYGPLRVERAPDGSSRRLRHGITLHGFQRSAPAEAAFAGAYYHDAGPFGDAVRAFHDQPEPRGRSVGAVGLGVGTVAAYARTGEAWRFFELDPLVARLADDPTYFSFLADGRARGATIDIAIGDARQTLQREPDGAFAWLVLDAFSSDAIPLHLLTREALEIYTNKVHPEGFVLFHLSNLQLTLPPVVGATATSLGLALRCRQDGVLSAAEVEAGHWPSTWCVLLPPRTTARFPSSWHAPPTGKHAWTDERASVLDAVDWR
jgi:hypothetical protein